MAILLYHDDKNNGQVGLAEGKVAGEHTHARHYRHKGHFLEVSGFAHVLEHDVQELKKLGYRLATAIEQQEYARQQKKAESLQESSKGDK